jgi:Uncharacterized protein conserved in bacteria
MPPETEQHELEMRIAFLEDQIDGMNQVLVTQSRQIDGFESELKRLVSQIRPFLDQLQTNGSDDTAPPPHY